MEALRHLDGAPLLEGCCSFGDRGAHERLTDPFSADCSFTVCNAATMHDDIRFSFVYRYETMRGFNRA